ncbi:aspartate carbamoyltransferase catalytic subunit [Hydrogenimonas cancrithermarum]|uniref:Aspartate carbamoyltransferase n=1 Tax=Hydrogenimonas cancrithermarum TaxID=2993563 RepID=A0ABM8FLN7_9BACT|nr:aspartate carbamoyltransferase catalytic subunit [Hydrogenimonas cancrithermarum]BDY12604.1 aspartate carbamoyltransferase [Hydrogenimonas cancrithermarum]
MRHLITTDDLTIEEIETLFKDAEAYLKAPPPKLLQNRLIITLFFENSTRTRSSFEIAAKKLGADVVHLDVAKSSTKKGETLYDTAANLNAMGPDAIIVRHAQSGTPYQISRHVDCAIFNAGDGAHAHPSQALLDLFTIRQHFGGDIEGKHIAIVGDIKNSRVANSNIRLLSRFGLHITLVAPPHFLPKTDLPTTTKLEEVLDEVDIVMSLRTQTERHAHPIYASLKDYASDYCITKERIGERDILLLHPGPVHRNIDIDDAMLADPRCKVLEQVRNGVAVRMAALKKLILANG